MDLGIIVTRGVQLDLLLNTFDNTSKNLGVKMEHRLYEVNGRMNIQAIEKEMNNCIQNGHNICLIVIPVNMKTQYKQIKMKSI